MSLWLDNYCGYDGTKNKISLDDTLEVKKSKALHMLFSLSEILVSSINDNDRNSILVDARSELNKIKGFNISLSELYSLPYININQHFECVDNYLNSVRMELEKNPGIRNDFLKKDYQFITINDIPRLLDANNINLVLNAYLKMMNSMEFSMSFNSKYQALCSLKRDPVGTGPYPDVSIFESANRILSDLVILFGVKNLLSGVFPEIKYSQYRVELGTESRNAHDITAFNENSFFNAEAFNVSVSLFNLKKLKSLKKICKTSSNADIKMLIFNADASKIINRECIIDGVYYLPIDIKI